MGARNYSCWRTVEQRLESYQFRRGAGADWRHAATAAAPAVCRGETPQAAFWAKWICLIKMVETKKKGEREGRAALLAAGCWLAASCFYWTKAQRDVRVGLRREVALALVSDPAFVVANGRFLQTPGRWQGGKKKSNSSQAAKGRDATRIGWLGRGTRSQLMRLRRMVIASILYRSILVLGPAHVCCLVSVSFFLLLLLLFCCVLFLVV